jgi:hypothetical protein
MIDEEEIYRRVRRFLELPKDQRPAKSYTLTKMAGIAKTSFDDIRQGHRMRPERLRRLSRVLELLEDGRIPDFETNAGGHISYKRIKIKREAAPPCQGMTVLDLTSGKPRMVTAFVNPNTLPELAITRVRK